MPCSRCVQDARKLDENEQALGQRLAQLNQDAARARAALRDDTAQQRQQGAQNFTQQGQQLEKLLDNMKQTVEQADASEPLLSRQLYDTIRNTGMSQTDKAAGYQQATGGSGPSAAGHADRGGCGQGNQTIARRRRDRGAGRIGR